MHFEGMEWNQILERLREQQQFLDCMIDFFCRKQVEAARTFTPDQTNQFIRPLAEYPPPYAGLALAQVDREMRPCYDVGVNPQAERLETQPVAPGPQPCLNCGQIHTIAG